MTINNVKLLLSDEQQMIIIRLQFSPALRNIFALSIALFFTVSNCCLSPSVFSSIRRLKDDFDKSSICSALTFCTGKVGTELLNICEHR